MKSKYSFLLIFILALTFAVNAQSSFEDEYDKQYAGFSFTMAETGSGIGGLIAWPVMEYTHLGLGLGAYFLRDKRQFSYIDPYSGYQINYGKENNVYLFDFMLSAKRRFFANDMDESLRPFLTGGIGPYYGMNYPEFDRKVDGTKTQDQFAWALGGFFGAGVDIDASATFFISIRAQYRVIPFKEYIGERKNHSMFELRFEIANRY